MTRQDSALAEDAKALQRQWMAAYTTRDTVFLNLCMSEDYVGIYPDGTVHNKQSEIEGVASGTIAVTAMAPKEMTSRVYSDTAVNTGQSDVTVKIDGKVVNTQLRFISVWTKSGARWRAVVHQVTRIGNPSVCAGAPDQRSLCAVQH